MNGTTVDKLLNIIEDYREENISLKQQIQHFASKDMAKPKFAGRFCDIDIYTNPKLNDGDIIWVGTREEEQRRKLSFGEVGQSQKQE